MIKDKPFSFRNYRFLRELYADESERIVVMKASQIGISEWCVNTALWFADTRGGNVLYCMPTQKNMDDFSQARVSPRIDVSSYLQVRSTRIDGTRGIDNVRLRELGKSYLYFRGSDQPKQIITIDADLLIRDELDWMTPKHVLMMEKRLGASTFKWIRDVSTPTYPEFGIHKEFLETDRRRYMLRCPHCGKNGWQELDFFENVKYKLDSDGEVKEAKVVCVRCGKPLDRLSKGEWKPDYPSRSLRGYKVNKLYSPLTSITELVRNSKRTSESDQQIFFNFDLGIVRSPKGGKVGRDLILACRDMGYEMPVTSMEPCSMGVDVGHVLNVRISQLTPQGRRAVFIGEVSGFADLSDLMLRFRVVSCCIDALPETRKVKEFADEFKGKVRLVYFTNQKELYRFEKDKEGYVQINCSRTQLLDEVAAEFATMRNILPRNVEEVPDYVKQVTAPVRVIEQDNQGRDVPRWISSGPDHYMFAEAYDLLALKLLEAYATTATVFDPNEKAEGGLDKEEKPDYAYQHERDRPRTPGERAVR